MKHKICVVLLTCFSKRDTCVFANHSRPKSFRAIPDR